MRWDDKVQERDMISGCKVSPSGQPRLVFMISDSMGSDLTFLPVIQKYKEETAAVFIVPYLWFSSFRLFKRTTGMISRAPWFYLQYKFLEVIGYRLLRWLGGWDSPKRLCRRAGIPLYRVSNVNDRRFLQKLVELKPDLILSMIPQIFGKKIINAFNKRLINVHHAILPEYRGAFAGTYWAVLNGETETGTTVHFIDTAVDGGDILVQKRISIEEEDSTYRLHAKLASLSPNCMEEVLTRYLQEQKLTGTPQDPKKAKTYSFPTVESYRRFRRKGKTLFRLKDFFEAKVLVR